MLYNPKWNKPKRFTWESLIGFLQTRNPQEEYNWGDCTGKCAFGQYLTSINLNMASYTRCIQTFGSPIAFDYPRTFGGMLDRARTLQMEELQ